MAVRRHPAVGPTGATGSTGLTGATGATGPAGTAPAGVPVLHGPYVVDYTDLPHDGDTMTLWTPQVGDVLLRLFPDVETVLQWDQGTVAVGQTVGGVSLGNAAAGNIGRSSGGALDSIVDTLAGQATDASGNTTYGTAVVFASADPVRAFFINGGPDPTHGHVALYALVARAVAP